MIKRISNKIAALLMDLLCDHNWRRPNAEIDKAPIWYRVPIEFWWNLEKKETRIALDYMHKHDDEDPPMWMQNVGIFINRRRCNAEDRALAQIGIYRGRYRKK